MLKGLYFEKTNNLQEAIAEYKNAQLISPDDIHANMELAKCYIAEHNYDDASKIIDQVKHYPVLQSKNKLMQIILRKFITIYFFVRLLQVYNMQSKL